MYSDFVFRIYKIQSFCFWIQLIRPVPSASGKAPTLHWVNQWTLKKHILWLEQRSITNFIYRPFGWKEEHCQPLQFQYIIHMEGNVEPPFTFDKQFLFHRLRYVEHLIQRIMILPYAHCFGKLVRWVTENGERYRRRSIDAPGCEAPGCNVSYEWRLSKST